MSSPATPEERYALLVASLLGEPGVAPPAREAPQQFGSTSMKANGKIFAMLVKGRLVVKLPASRVDALTAAGFGQRFDPGKGQLMKEWLSIAPTAEVEWLPLSREALEFVGRPPRRRAKGDEPADEGNAINPLG